MKKSCCPQFNEILCGLRTKSCGYSDSIMRGYPIGIALLWKTYLDLQYRRFNEAFHSGEIHDFKENRRRRKLKFLVTRRCACGTLYRLRWCNQHRTPGAKSLRHFCVSLLLTSRGY